MKTKYPQQTKRKCHKCGSNLLLMSVKVEKVPMQHNPVTTSTYNCSDTACQEASEKEMARFIKRREDQEAAKEERLQKAKEAKAEAKAKKEKKGK